MHLSTSYVHYLELEVPLLRQRLRGRWSGALPGRCPDPQAGTPDPGDLQGTMRLRKTAYLSGTAQKLLFAYACGALVNRIIENSGPMFLAALTRSRGPYRLARTRRRPAEGRGRSNSSLKRARFDNPLELGQELPEILGQETHYPAIFE